jgi:GTP-binding protein EngB required for normal cell division
LNEQIKTNVYLDSTGIRSGIDFTTQHIARFNNENDVEIYRIAVEKWIQENTSGVLIVEMRDTKRILNKQNVSNITLIDKLKVPFSNMMDNFDRTQDYDQEQLMELSKTSFGFPVDIVSFNLRESVDDRISLSWHLTGREKQKIQAALNSPENRNSLLELKKHLGYNLDIR